MYQIIGVVIFIVILFYAVQVLWALLPFIIIYMVIKAILNKGKPKPTRRTQYYSSTSAKDFEEFFRQAGGNQNYENFNYNGGNGQNPFGAMEDKSKYYALLGVESSATQDELKKAYRSLARKHHPDRYATADDDIKAHHERKFKEINEAYDKVSK